MRGLLVVFLFLLVGIFHGDLNAQCENWNDSSKKEDGETAHSVYQGAIESGDFKIAFEYWQKAYNIAPAADGKRASHYIDGITIYEHKYENATSDEEREEFKNWILRLYSEAATCYQNHAITLSNCSDESCYDAEAGYYLGRKGYAMFYTFNSPREEVYETMKTAVELAGNKSEYIVFVPLTYSLIDEFKKGKIGIDEVRSMHKKMLDIIQYNIDNGNYPEQFEATRQVVEQNMRTIEDEVYDCDYFMETMLPEYEANKEDGEILEKVYRKLKSKGCPDSLPIMQELEVKYAEYVEEYNRRQMEELAKTNPAIAAKLAYEDDRYTEAIGHYREAIELTEDNDKKADYYFNIASIQGRKLHQYSSAVSNARRAANLRSGWGRPYMLIGDLYASGSSQCGDSWNQRLAILAAIDKYAFAKQIDPSETSVANQRIATYRNSMPQREQAFMRGLKEGDRVKLDCWIGETVTLRF